MGAGGAMKLLPWLIIVIDPASCANYVHALGLSAISHHTIAAFSFSWLVRFVFRNANLVGRKFVGAQSAKFQRYTPYPAVEINASGCRSQ